MDLIAEDLLLLLLDDETGKLAARDKLDVALGGALLVELALAETVVVERSGMLGRRKVEAIDGAPTPRDLVLADALELIREKPRSAKDLVGKLGKHRREPLLERLVADGVLRREEGALGILSRDRWPAEDMRREQAVRAELRAALVDGAEPDQRTAALIALLSAIDRAHKSVDHEGVSGRQVKKRAKQIAEGNWAAKGVKDAIDEATAVMVTVMASGAAAGSN